MPCGDLCCDDVAVAVAVAGAGVVCLARFPGAVFEDAELCVFDDLSLNESLAELFVVRVAVVRALQDFGTVARGIDCIAFGCAFLDDVA